MGEALPDVVTTAIRHQDESDPVVVRPGESRVISGQICLISFRKGHGIHGVLLSQGDGPGLGAQTSPPSSPIVPAKPNFPAIQKVTFWAQLHRGTTVVRIRLRS